MGDSDGDLRGRVSAMRGWPMPDSTWVAVHPQRGLCILNEEWHQRLYAERDRDVLESHGRQRHEPERPWRQKGLTCARLS
jgi:hypothetical protein